MATAKRWTLRIEPYNPDAVDADGDGIVQEGTAWERPGGTRLVDKLGQAIERGRSLTERPEGLRVVDKNGKEIPYTPTYDRGGGLNAPAPSGGTPMAAHGAPSLRELGLPSVQTSTVPPPPPPVKAEAPKQQILPGLEPKAPKLYIPQRDATPNPLRGELGDIVDGASSWKEVKEAIEQRGIVFFDYETTGIDPVTGHPGAPTQIGAVKIQGGKIVERLNLFTNPKKPLSDWSKKNLKDKDGNPLTDEWAAEQMDLKEAHQKLTDFFGDSLIGAHNAMFDYDTVLQEQLSEHGLTYEPPGVLDTLELARQVVPKGEGGTKGHGLAALMEFFGDAPTGWHTADADAEDTKKLFDGIFADAEKRKTDFGILKVQEEKALERSRKVEADKKSFRDALTKYREEREAYEQRLRNGDDLPELGPEPALPDWFDENAVDYDIQDVLDWDALGLDGDDEDMWDFWESAKDNWETWDGAREMRAAAYGLAGAEPGAWDPHIDRKDTNWRVNRDEAETTEGARFFMAQLAQSRPEEDPLFRAMKFLNKEQRTAFWQEAQVGTTVDIPLLSFADRRSQGPNEFLAQNFGSDVLLEVEPGAQRVTLGHFAPMYSDADENDTLIRLNDFANGYAEDYADEEVEGVDEMVTVLKELLEDYEKSRTASADQRLQLRDDIEAQVQDMLGEKWDDVYEDAPLRWAGADIQEEDRDYYWEAMENPESNRDITAFEEISGGRFLVTGVEDDPNGVFDKIVKIRQTGVFDPQRKGGPDKKLVKNTWGS
jgi:DNA polymerase III epsilon subunit-like protein